MGAGFVEIPKYKNFGGKRYTLKDAFVAENTAKQLKARYKRLGYKVRIYQKSGVMHVIARYHVFVRKG